MINRFLIFILILNVSFSLEEFIDGVVAKVGENTIVNSDVLQTIQIQAMQKGVDLSKNSFFVDENYSQALDFLINQHVIYEIAKKACNQGLDGLMIEVHHSPNNALSDSAQQLSPEEFKQLLTELEYPT